MDTDNELPGLTLLRQEFEKAGHACNIPNCLRYQKEFVRPSDWWWHLSTRHPGTVRHHNASQRLFDLNTALTNPEAG